MQSNGPKHETCEFVRSRNTHAEPEVQAARCRQISTMRSGTDSSRNGNIGIPAARERLKTFVQQVPSRPKSGSVHSGPVNAVLTSLRGVKLRPHG